MATKVAALGPRLQPFLPFALLLLGLAALLAAALLLSAWVLLVAAWVLGMATGIAVREADAHGQSGLAPFPPR